VYAIKCVETNVVIGVVEMSAKSDDDRPSGETTQNQEGYSDREWAVINYCLEKQLGRVSRDLEDEIIELMDKTPDNSSYLNRIHE